MNLKGWIVLLGCLYLSLNFICALVLHLHAERQAHLRVRFLDVFMHFMLLTAFGIPVLLVVVAEALFGRAARNGQAQLPPAAKISHAGARAA